MVLEMVEDVVDGSIIPEKEWDEDEFESEGEEDGVSTVGVEEGVVLDGDGAATIEYKNVTNQITLIHLP